VSLEFVKAHGTGNDFVVIEDLDDRHGAAFTPEFVRLVCDRHLGIGADGLIRIAPGSGRSAPFFMDYRNADGSVAEMCGNGARVVAKYLGDRGYVGGAFDLETRAGVKHLKLHVDNRGCVDQVTVDMGAPGPAREQPLALGGLLGPGWDGTGTVATLVSLGNPHAVVFVDGLVADLDQLPVETAGPRIEHDRALFPARGNVEFVQVLDQGAVRVRTWERGVGETLACGTGACAVAVAGQLRGLTGERLTVRLRGGDLRLDWAPGRNIRMTGPAREVAHGTLGADLLALLGQGTLPG
jgi:diaminopimelate epimerase